MAKKKNLKIKTERFMTNVIVVMISQILIKLVGLVYKIYLTNKEGFGDAGNAIYGSGYQIYALLLLISSIGIPSAIAKLVSEKVAKDDYKGAYRVFQVSFYTVGIIGFICTLILFFGASFISNNLLLIPEAELTLKCLAPSIVIVALSSVIRGYFNGRNSMKATANSQSLEQIFKTLFTIIIVELIAFGYSNDTTLMAAGATLATTISIILSYAYIYIFYKKRKSVIHEEMIQYNDNYIEENLTKTIKTILAIAIPISLTSIISSINKSIDSVTVIRGLTSFMSQAEAKLQYGILTGKVDTLVSIPLSLNTAIAVAILPYLSYAYERKDSKGIQKNLHMAILVTVLIALPCAFGMSIYAKPILDLVFPNANAGANILAAISPLIVFSVLTQTINSALQGLGDYKTPVIALIIGAIVKTVLNFILIPIPSIGIYGAIISSVACQFIAFIVGYIALKKMTSLKLNRYKVILRPLVSVIIMSIVSYIFYCIIKGFSPTIALLVAIGIAVIVYGLLILNLHVFSKKELQELPLGNKLVKFMR